MTENEPGGCAPLHADEKMREAFELDHECAFTGNNEYERGYASGYLSALSQPAAVDGWKYVPVEPTLEMRTAAIREQGYIQRAGLGLQGDSPAADIYRAMLAAAPTPPQDNVIAEFANKQEPLGAEFSKVLYENLDSLYEITPPQEQPEAVEPVADVQNGNVRWLVDNWPDNTKLYTMPPTAKQALRMAADKLREFANECHSCNATPDDLREVAREIEQLIPPTNKVTMTREKFEEKLLDVAKEAYKQGEHDGRFPDEYSSARPATIVAQHMPEESK